MVGEASEKLWFVQELEIWQSLLFLLDLLKNSEQSKSNVPKHSLKVFWVTTLVTEKKLSKILLSWGNLVLQKGTKKRKISLGYCLVVWEVNDMCTFISEYETLKYSKGNYLKSKLQIFFKMLVKKRIISARSLKIWLYMQNGTDI